MREHKRAKKDQHLTAALYHYHHAYETTNEKHDQYSAIMINYASALNAQDQLFGRQRNLQEVIRILAEARTIMEQPHSRKENYGLLLNNLAQAYLDQYRQSCSSADFTSARETFERARSQDVSSPGSPIYTTSLIGSATALWTACELQPQPNDVDLPRLKSAIDYLETAQGQNSQNITIRTDCYRHLASVYDLRYKRTKNPQDLDLSIEHYSQASVMLGPQSTNHAPTLFNLAKQQFERHKLTKDPADMKAAEQSRDAARELVEQVPGAEELKRQIKDLTSNMVLYAKRGQSDTSSVWSATSGDAPVSRQGTMLSISEEPDSFSNDLQLSQLAQTRTSGEKSASLGPLPKPQATGRGLSTQVTLGHHQQQPSVVGVPQNDVVSAMASAASQRQMTEVEQQNGSSLR